MSEFRVSSLGELEAALSNASNGDVVLLAEGDYGRLALNSVQIDGNVTIKPEGDAGTAVLGSLDINNCAGLTFEGINVFYEGSPGPVNNKLVHIKSSHDIQILDSDISGPPDGPRPIEDFFGVYVTGSSTGINVSGNSVHHVLNGISFFGGGDYTVCENHIEDVGSDAFKFSGVDGALVENNLGPKFFHSHPVYHEDFMQFQGPPSHNVVVKGNVFIPQNCMDVQGIFLNGQGGHSNITIENNLLYTVMHNGILVKHPGEGVEIFNNTLINTFSDSHPSTTIVVSGQAEIYNNIISGHDGEIDGDNLVIQHTDESQPFHFFDLFDQLNADPENLDITNFFPTTGGLGEQYGAFERLAELRAELDGGPTPPTDDDGTDEEPADDTSDEPGDDTADEPGDDTSDEPGDDTEPSDDTPDEPSDETPEDEEDDPDLPPEDDGDDPADTEVVWAYDAAAFSGHRSQVMEMAHDEAMNLDSGSVSFRFAASDLNGNQGLFSKDAKAVECGHMSVYLKEDKLIALFQGEDGVARFEVTGIEADRMYDFTATFGDHGVAAWLDGEQIGARDIIYDWTANDEWFQVGGRGMKSATDEAGYNSPFAGLIEELRITNGGMDEPPADDGPRAVLSVEGAVRFDGQNQNVLTLAHDEATEMDAGTIAFSFLDDGPKGRQGLISKDAANFGDGGHFTAYLRGGDLHVRFQNDSDSEVLIYEDIDQNREYEVAATFGDDGVALWVDGVLVDTDEFVFSMAENTEYLQVGALGWTSKPGSDSFRKNFTGEIADLEFYDDVLDAQMIATLADHSSIA